MFENLVHQDASKYLISDIRKQIFPGAVLFSGDDASGKLTAALEVSRVLSCWEHKGEWNCECPSCLRQKNLTCTNILLMGPRECALEIEAAKDTFLKAYSENAKYLTATRYLYLRSIRKLTLRFSPILYKGDKNVNKIGNLIDEINEILEQLDFPKDLPPLEKLTELCTEANELALKLENDFLYNSIPISQIRNMEEWAYIKTEEGKKTIIIENAEKMQASVRNALLKILEEPPADCIFILLTAHKNAVMQTILSRVRNYSFKNRDMTAQKEVVSRVFHNEEYTGSVSDFLLSYLPVPVDTIRKEAENFLKGIVTGAFPEISTLLKNCNKFEPKIEFKLFLNQLMVCRRDLLKTPEGCEASNELSIVLRDTYESVFSYNQSIQGALENLIREISRINQTYGKIITKVFK